MATLTSSLIDRILRKFHDRGQVDILDADMDASTTSLSYRGFLPQMGEGVRVEIGSETMLVIEDDSVNNTAVVVRGWEGTATTHSEDDPIYVNPRIYRVEVLELINDSLEDLFGRDLYAVGSEEIIYDPGLIGYNLPADLVEILRVDGLKDDSAKYWEPIGDWLETDNTDTTDFASGKAIMLRTALPPGAFRVIYSKPFTRVTDETKDLEADAGLRPYMVDLPYYYAMNRLMVDLERHRSQIESAEGHQRSQDSPPFLALRTGEWYQARYEDRVIIARNHLSKEVHRARFTGYGS